MGKRGGQSLSGFHTSLSLREEASGKKQSHNAKSLLKLKHLQNLAEWASSDKDAEFGCLGAFFGRRFAELGESLGVSPDPSLFPCQRCETILQPGFNCTIRIVKSRAKRRRRSKVKIPTQNNVVYTCHFCSHGNLKRGTPKGYMKEIASSRVISSNPVAVLSGTPKSSTADKSDASNVKTDKATATATPTTDSISVSLTDNPTSPLASTTFKTLDSKKRKRKKTAGSKDSANEALVSSAPLEKADVTSKRKRKTWSTLKDIAEEEERERNKRFSNFSIPFVL